MHRKDFDLMMMMMNYFCGMVDRRKAFTLISSRDHCQWSSPSRISGTSRVGFEPAQNLSSGFLELSCAAVITTAPRRHQEKRKKICMFVVPRPSLLKSTTPKLFSREFGNNYRKPFKKPLSFFIYNNFLYLSTTKKPEIWIFCTI